MTTQDTRLAEAVERLEAAYATARAELTIAGHDYTPEQIKDTTGRYILLDALVAIVQARTALAASDTP